MSQIPPSQPGPIINQYQTRTNGLGIAGFVVSLVGLVGICIAPGFLLSLVGTILSAVAMAEQPRGFAIAGLVLGLIGVLWLIVVVLIVGGVLAAGLAGGMSVARTAAREIKASTEVLTAVEDYRYKNAKPPADIDALVQAGLLKAAPTDGAGHCAVSEVCRSEDDRGLDGGDGRREGDGGRP